MNMMNKGLGFNGNRAQKAAYAAPVNRSVGKFVLKDLTATAEVFELLSVSVQGVNGAMQIRLRSTYDGAIYFQDNFWKIRPAFENEVKANARQGSDQFTQYWAAHSHQYY